MGKDNELKPHQHALLTRLNESEAVKYKDKFHLVITDGAINYSLLRAFSKEQCSVLTQMIEVEEQKANPNVKPKVNPKVNPKVTPNISQEIESLKQFIKGEFDKFATAKWQRTTNTFFTSPTNKTRIQYMDYLAEFAVYIEVLDTSLRLDKNRIHLNDLTNQYLQVSERMDTVQEYSKKLPSDYDRAPITKAKETLAKMKAKPVEKAKYSERELGWKLCCAGMVEMDQLRLERMASEQKREKEQEGKTPSTSFDSNK